MTISNILIKDTIQDIVNQLNLTGSILSFTNLNNGKYRVLVNDINNLVNGDYITISNTTNFNGSYVISNVNVINKTFEIEKSGSYNTQTGVYSENKPYFFCGHIITLTNKLIEKNKSGEFKYQKYPLIFLLDEIDSEINRDKTKIEYSKQNLTLWFISPIDFRNTANEPDSQYDNVIKPVLIDLIDRFILALENSNKILENHINYNQHIHTNFGLRQTNGNSDNILPDWVACVEIKFDVTLSKQYSCN